MDGDTAANGDGAAVPDAGASVGYPHADEHAETNGERDAASHAHCDRDGKPYRRT
jgi:hypothetical protein